MTLTAPEKIIYLSPHLDDAVYSCGGIIWEQLQKGIQVEVWSIFTADPPKNSLSPFADSLHQRWSEQHNPMLTRREEDINALNLLGCSWRHLNFPDCIYRRDQLTDEPVIKTVDDLFSVSYKVELDLVQAISANLKIFLDQKSHLVVPLGVGRHIDHRVTRLSAEKLGVPLTYYPDFPYAAIDPDQITAYLPGPIRPLMHRMSVDGLTAWQNGIASYRSQMSSFWDSIDAMRAALLEYSNNPVSSTLWTTLES